MNFLVRSYLKRFDRELQEMHTAQEVQQRRVFNYVIDSPHSRFFAGDRLAACQSSYGRFRQEVPISTYEDYRAKVEQLMMPSAGIRTEFIARSSGTTSERHKLIPTPEKFVRINHLRASWYILYTLFRHRPGAAVFNRRNLLVGGSIYSNNGTQLVGDVSGIMLFRIPLFFRPFCLPDIPTAVLPDWSEKINRTAAMASRVHNIGMMAGTPTWLLAVIKRVLELRGGTHASALWPGLQSIVHGGLSIAPYREQFENLFNGSQIMYLETYNASEGFFGFQNELDDQSLLLMTANGIFYEFIPFEEYKKGSLDARPLEEIDLDKPYVLIVSTSSGLLRYVVGDVITFTGRYPYKIRVMGRITDYINAFGEDLLLTQAEEAITRTASIFGIHIREFTVAPSFLSLSASGFHEWYIEFENPPGPLEQFAECLDALMRKYNPNYDQKRTGNMAMGPLKVREVPYGGFEAFLEAQRKLNGQAKIPRLRNDRQLAEALDQIINRVHAYD